MSSDRPGAGPMPAAEIELDESVLRAAVGRQFPDLAHHEIAIVANGWDNVVARIGEDLAIRAPRRRAAVDLAEHEWSWLRDVAARLPIEVPMPVRRGAPDDLIPWTWLIVRWIDGVPADASGPASVDDAGLLASVLRDLAVPAPPTAPANPYRGVPLAQRADRVEEYLGRIGGPDEDALRSIWADALGAPEYDGAPVWLHGDLHPANLVTRAGRLVGIIDWGDLTAGDPAADLQVAWTWCGPGAREVLLCALDHGEDTIRRARGNALAHGAATVASSADNPRMAAVGAATLRQVLLDARTR